MFSATCNFILDVTHCICLTEENSVRRQQYQFNRCGRNLVEHITCAGLGQQIGQSVLSKQLLRNTTFSTIAV